MRPTREALAALLSSGVRDPFAIVMEEVRSPTEAVIKGRDTILLGTYNYMGMTFDPDVIAAGEEALRTYGSGTNGSRMLNGTFRDHVDAEEALKEFYGARHAMVFSTGYQANLGLMSTIAGKEDYIILDADSHASIYDGCVLGNEVVLGAGAIVVIEPLREQLLAGAAVGARLAQLRRAQGDERDEHERPQRGEGGEAQAGLLLRQRDEFLHALHRQRGMHHHQVVDRVDLDQAQRRADRGAQPAQRRRSTSRPPRGPRSSGRWTWLASLKI